MIRWISDAHKPPSQKKMMSKWLHPIWQVVPILVISSTVKTWRVQPTQTRRKRWLRTMLWQAISTHWSSPSTQTIRGSVTTSISMSTTKTARSGTWASLFRATPPAKWSRKCTSNLRATSSPLATPTSSQRPSCSTRTAQAPDNGHRATALCRCTKMERY